MSRHDLKDKEQDQDYQGLNLRELEEIEEIEELEFENASEQIFSKMDSNMSDINVKKEELNDGEEPTFDTTIETDIEGRQLETKEASSTTLAPPPNGGTIAWIQVFGSFILFMNSWGLVNAFGVFQTYYESDILKGTSPSTISWIGSIQGFLVINGGIVTGRLYDAGYLRELLIMATFCLSFGMMMTSLSTEFWQLFLSQGVLVGIGCACAFCPSVAVLSSYFTTRKSTAIGIAASGSSLGGIIYPIMARELIPKVGFPWAARIIGFMVFGTMCISVIVQKSRIPPRKSGPPIHIESLTDVPFLLLSVGILLCFTGLYIPIFYIQTYALAQGVETNLAFYLLSILNAGSVLGRIVPNMVADRTGPFNILIPCCAVSSLLAFCWIAITSSSGLIAFAVLYGCFTGGLVSLPPSCLASITKDLSVLGSRMGMAFFIIGFGILIGTPVAGAIINHQNGGFLGAQLFSGCTLVLGSIFICCSRFLLTGPKLLVKK